MAVRLICTVTLVSYSILPDKPYNIKYYRKWHKTATTHNRKLGDAPSINVITVLFAWMSEWDFFFYSKWELFSYIMARTGYNRWDDNVVHFVLDLQAELDCPLCTRPTGWACIVLAHWNNTDGHVVALDSIYLLLILFEA